MADRFDVGAADSDAVQLEHALRGVIGELKPSLAIHHDDALDHAGEDRFHPSTVPGLLAEPPSDVLHRLVQRARHHAQLVVAEIHQRRRQISASVPPRDVGNAPHALSDPR